VQKRSFLSARGRHDSPFTSIALCVFCLLCAACLIAPTSVSAQVATASINGTVRDTSGAVIPGAEVVLSNVATNVEQTTMTNGSGTYVVLNIPPGDYSLRVSKQGFTSAKQNITLVVNQSTSYDFTLSVGATRQAVTVKGSAVALQTSTAGLGVAVVSQQVNDLPLNGRNFTQLLELTPGVSPVNVSQNTAGGDVNAIGAFSFPSINGQINRSNMYLLDGLNDLEPYRNEYAVAPIVDDIREFKVDSHNDQAQFGGILGGTVNVVTKSGTNQLHGTLWEFLRNEKLDARNPFFARRNPLRQNQFGGDIGGPVILPHYNGKNKTFFFASYEGLRRVQSAQNLFRVPTPSELTGNLSDLGVPIYNPFSTRPDPNKPGEFLRDEFPNAMIPQNLLDQNMVKLAQSLFPSPVNTGVPGTNGLDNTPLSIDSNEENFRIDEQLNPRNSLWFRFSRVTVGKTGSGGYEGLLARHLYTAHQLGANWTHTFGPSAVLAVKFGRTNARQLNENRFSNINAQNLSQETNLSQNFACGFKTGPACLIPNFSLPGFLSGGESNVNRHLADIWEGRADLSIIHGAHIFSMGFDFNTDNFSQPSNNVGAGFSSFQTSNLESPSGVVTGNALASFLLGAPDNALRTNVLETEYGGKVIDGYFQDQWKATRKLTVNLGVRYDVSLLPVYGSLQDGNQYVGDLNLNDGTYIVARVPESCDVTHAAPCIPGGQLPDHVVVTSQSNGQIFHNTYDNVQPRVGLAYRLGSRSVLRASYGRVYDNWSAVTQLIENYEGAWPDIGQLLANNLNASYVTVTAENPFAQANALPAPTPFTQVQWFEDPLQKNAYSDQWNFEVQRQLTSNTLVSATYVGSHDSRLNLGGYRNVAVTPGPGDAATVASRQPYPYIAPTYYDQSIGRSSYNAFQFSLNRRSTKGLSYLISYTYSKSMDIACSGFFGVEGCSIQNPYNLNNDRSVSGFDLTHILSASWVDQLPFGHGRKFSSNNKFANAVIGEWAVNGILTLTSGVPYEIGVSGDIANTGNSGCCSGFYERANLVGDPTLSNPSPSLWFNKSAFQVPAPYTFGSLGRNSLRADWFKDLDLSIFREFPITETKRLEFRAEMFNFTNTPTWGTPVNNMSVTNFGRVLSTRSTEREVQFSLKLYF
jgi:Carboxypeptidase regulatory-like domain/TonB dependent receptor-like, beta-barrel